MPSLPVLSGPINVAATPSAPANALLAGIPATPVDGPGALAFATLFASANGPSGASPAGAASDTVGVPTSSNVPNPRSPIRLAASEARATERGFPRVPRVAAEDPSTPPVAALEVALLQAAVQPASPDAGSAIEQPAASVPPALDPDSQRNTISLPFASTETQPAQSPSPRFPDHVSAPGQTSVSSSPTPPPPVAASTQVSPPLRGSGTLPPPSEAPLQSSPVFPPVVGTTVLPSASMPVAATPVSPLVRRSAENSAPPLVALPTPTAICPQEMPIEKFLSAQDERDTNSFAAHGIAPANLAAAMRPDHPTNGNLAPSPAPVRSAFVETATAGVHGASYDAAADRSLGSVEAVTPTGKNRPSLAAPESPAVGSAQISPHVSTGLFTSVAASSEASAPSADSAASQPSARAVDAAGVVTHVVELTHEFRGRDRNTVEVDFSTSDDTRLSVRLHLRDGEVQTTFRTDSDALRSALHEAWHARPGHSSAAESAFRLAEPVFAHASAVPPERVRDDRPPASPAYPDFSDAASGGDARQREHSSQAAADLFAGDPRQPPHHRGATHPAHAFSARSNPAVAATPARPAPTDARRVQDRRFHAFA